MWNKSKSLQYLVLLRVMQAPPGSSHCLSWVCCCSTWRQGVARASHTPLSASITPRDVLPPYSPHPARQHQNLLFFFFVHWASAFTAWTDYVTVKQCRFLNHLVLMRKIDLISQLHVAEKREKVCLFVKGSHMHFKEQKIYNNIYKTKIQNKTIFKKKMLFSYI